MTRFFAECVTSDKYDTGRSRLGSSVFFHSEVLFKRSTAASVSYQRPTGTLACIRIINMKQSRRKTADTSDGVNQISSSARMKTDDDGTTTSRFSNATDATLTSYPKASHDKFGQSIDDGRGAMEHDSIVLDEREEASAAIDALNEFIFVAGHTFKGRRLNIIDQQRLQEAARQVGLSLEVVDALVEQTSDPNAVLNYCLASDDAFATRMKNDPQLSRLLEAGAKRENISGFDVAASVWRIFMHKIVQQFLKDHGMNLSDVMSRESLTSRLYKEALRNETKSFTVGFDCNQGADSRIQRDYTMERQKLIISDQEAQLARQNAEANMHMPTHASFANASGVEYYTSDDRSIATDDVLSLRPGMYPADDRRANLVGPEAFQRSQQSDAQTLLEGGASLSSRPQQAASEPRQREISTVRRALAVFSTPQPPGRDETKRQRRRSLDQLEKSKVVAARTVREGEIDLAEIDEAQPPSKARQSLLAIKETETRVLKSKGIFERGTSNTSISPDEAIRIKREKARSTAIVKKLNPEIKRIFEGPVEGHKPDSSIGAEFLSRAPTGTNVVHATKRIFETTHNDSKNKWEQRIKQEGQTSTAKPRKAHTGARGLQEITQATLPPESLVKQLNSKAKPPASVLATICSDDSVTHFSDVTQSTSSIESNRIRQEPGQALVSRDNRTLSLHDQLPASRSSPSPFLCKSQQKKWQKTKLPDATPDLPVDGVLTNDGRVQRLTRDKFDVDETHGWVGFGDEFIVPPDSRSYEQRLGRGLSEDDKNSLRQPVGPPLTDSEVVLRERQDFVQHKFQASQPSPSPSKSRQKQWQKRISPDTTPCLPVDGIPTNDGRLPRQTGDKFNVEANHGWVIFGDEFIGPPVRSSYEHRSGRGLSEGDNESLRQPTGSPSADSEVVLRERQDFLQYKSRSSPSLNPRKAQHRHSNTPQPIELGIQPEDKENNVVPVESGDWTSFQNSPFKDFGGLVSVENVQQMHGVLQPVQQHSKGHWGTHFGVSNMENIPVQLKEQSSVQSSGYARIDPFRTGVYTKETSRHRIADDASNDVIWQANRSDQFESVLEREMGNSIHQDTAQPHEPSKQFQSTHAHLKNSQNEGDFRHPFRSQNVADGSSSHSQNQPTEAIRSMSSDSDFTGFNSYKESDMKRIQTLHSGLVHTRNNTPVLSSSHRSHDQIQPDAPLLSKRGSRASTLIDTSREFQGIDHFPSAANYDIEWQKDMNSVQVSTIPSNSDSMVQGGVAFLQKVNRENSCVVECPVILQQPCKIDPNKTCSVRGVPLIESSFLPMNGGPPIKSVVKRSDSENQSLGDENDTSSLDEWRRHDEQHCQATSSRNLVDGALSQAKLHSAYEERDGHPTSYSYHAHSNSVLVGSDPRLCRQTFPSSQRMPTDRPATSSISHQDSQVMYSDYGMTMSNDARDAADTHRSRGGSREIYLDDPSFEHGQHDPTSPTQLRSADSESTIDEEDLRRAAERRGFSQELVDAVLEQRSSKIRRAPLKGASAILPASYQNHEAPIDSDTCQPASPRYLQKVIGPDGNDPTISWGAIENEEEYTDLVSGCLPKDPSPRQVQQALLATVRGTESHGYQSQVTFSHQNPEVRELFQEDISDEDLKLLNRFVEVASINFDGKRLSPESEQRVRAAAAKVGLSQKFVDQLLQQANANNTTQYSAGNFSLAAVGVSSPALSDDQSTYVTNDQTRSTKPKRRKKRSKEDVGCDAWQQWENLSNLVRGWANCGAPGNVHHSDDDASSISSIGYTDELNRKLHKAQMKVKNAAKRNKLRNEV